MDTAESIFIFSLINLEIIIEYIFNYHINTNSGFSPPFKIQSYN
jgi:hypothetical protein